MEVMMNAMPLSTPPTKPTNWWKTIPGQAAILALLAGLILIALGAFGVIGPRANSNPLADTDPAGAAACDTLADWLNGNLVESKAGVTQLVEAQTVNAHTGDIKRTGAMAAMRTGDLVDVHAACVDAGVKMPAYKPPVG